jgi:acetyl esterase/lipase
MTTQSVDLLDEARTFNAALEEILATVPAVHTVPPEVTRAARASGEGIFGPVVEVDEAVDLTIDGRGGPIRLRVLRPPRVDAVYLHIHGGGWVLGAADQQDPLLWHLANAANVAVVSVDYRLAPEHPYPAGPDDCEDAALWAVAHAASDLGSGRLLIGGESAGAHLAAVTMLRLRDRHGLTPFEAANLVFGAFDLSWTPSVRAWGDRNLILSTPIIEWFGECFLPGIDAEARRDPDISPLYADLRGLPPALFTVGALDPLLDDTLFMAARWGAAGNGTDLLVQEEGVHGFIAYPIGIGRAAIARAADFVQRAAAGTGMVDQ